MAEAVTISTLMGQGVLSMGDGYRTKRAEHGEPGHRIIRVADVRDGNVYLDGDDFVSDRYIPQMGAKIAVAGDVLLTTKGTVGRVAVMPVADEPAVYSPQLCYFRIIDREVLDPRYLRYWFASREFLAQASFLQGNTDMAPYISLSDLRAASITLPSRSKQTAIAEVLGALDDRIAVNTRLAATAEELLRAEFERMRVDAEPCDSDEAAIVSDLFKVNPRRGKPASDEPVYLDMARLPTNSFSVSEWTRRAPRGGVRFMNGDTIMARITPCLENGKVGYVDFLADGEVGIGSTEYITLRSRTERGVPLELSYFLARSPRFQANAVQHMVGSSGRQRLAGDDIKPFALRKPDASALVRFGEMAGPLFRHVRSLIRENATLAATRDTLLPQLMSGKLRVRDAEVLAEEAGL